MTSQTLTHFEAAHAWAEGMENGTLTGRVFSSSTSQIYCYYAVDFFTTYDVLSESTLKSALASIPAENFAKREKYHRTLISLAKYLVAEGILAEPQLVKMQKLRPKRHLPPKKTVVDAENLAILLEACVSKLDQLIVTLLSSTGIRATEACNIKINDINFAKQSLTIRVGKWGKSRRVGLSLNAVQAIQLYLEGRAYQSNEYLFLNRKNQKMDRHGLNQRLQRIGKLAGIPVSPHALRRAFVTINANNGKPLHMLQMACGHSDIETTRSYCMTTEEEVINAMKTWG
ncbi:tyrosine-type recombinase/integrase [Vampirovibrio chlorellavorus]|uniref:tyrosine-type recombinase/integrase n=1 Tax=Vampirovibrio chlorellavorus TaxID=758823 RepID=UPI0026F20AFD|nr:site-specific integrase [Vampirovibrio chlorellavorus]